MVLVINGMCVMEDDAIENCLWSVRSDCTSPNGSRRNRPVSTSQAAEAAPYTSKSQSHGQSPRSSAGKIRKFDAKGIYRLSQRDLHVRFACTYLTASDESCDLTEILRLNPLARPHFHSTRSFPHR